MHYQRKTNAGLVSSMAIILCLLSGNSCARVNEARSTLQHADNYRAAADYSKSVRGLSLLVIRNGKVVFEEYHNGHSSSEKHMLASGTKSFSGVMCAAAIEDGLINSLDEQVSETIVEWKNDRRKSQITIRELLSLTSGIETGPNGRPPKYSDAVKFDTRFDPGTTFEYGPVPFQIFGEVMRRKLASRNESVLDYLKQRIFVPIGLEIVLVH